MEDQHGQSSLINQIIYKEIQICFMYFYYLWDFVIVGIDLVLIVCSVK